MRVILVLAALFSLSAAYPRWYNYGVFDLGQNIERRSSQPQLGTRLEPRGGSLVSGRGAFRPGYADDSLANILAGFDGRRKRMSPNSDDDLSRQIDLVIPTRFLDAIRVRH
uniref:Uncharacterized protein n=1 Tax=Plectus sambesii TaxID=2011161 RepID=A0A914W670_9BILA